MSSNSGVPSLPASGGASRNTALQNGMYKTAPQGKQVNFEAAYGLRETPYRPLGLGLPSIRSLEVEILEPVARPKTVNKENENSACQHRSSTVRLWNR
jgi:hypothetical protein